MKLFFVLLALLSAGTSYAQRNIYSLRGSVTTATGEPLEGASVFIADLNKGAVADGNGNYVITHVPEGTYLVQANFIGYKAAIQKVEVASTPRADFSLMLAITEEDEIVVTGTSRAGLLKQNPIPIVSVGKDELLQNPHTNIIDAVATVPGVSAVTTGPNISKPMIRGLGFNRVLTMYDGVRQEGQQWGNEHGVEVDENVIRKVEIVKGPASLLYGSDALAGVVNLIPASPPATGRFAGTFDNAYHTNNGLISSSLTGGKNYGDYFWQGTASHKMAADYRNQGDGRVYNTGFRENSITLSSGMDKTFGYSRLSASFYNNLQEIPNGERDSATWQFVRPLTEEGEEWEIVPEKYLRSYSISPVHQHIQHFRIYNTTSLLTGRDRIHLGAGFQKNIRKEFEDPEGGDAALFLNLNTFTYDAKYLFHETQGWSVTAGVNGMAQINKIDRGHEFIIPAYRQTDAGPFVYTKKTAGPWEFAGGLRYDWRRLHSEELYLGENSHGEEVPVYGADTVGALRLFSPFKETFGGWSGSAGVSYRVNGTWNLKFNLSRGYRAPTISEISANGIHAGAALYQLGNADFEPEFSFQQDLGVTFTSEHLTIQAEVFNNTIDNYIYNQKLLSAAGGDSVIIEGYETFQYVASRAALRGGELFIDVHPHPLDWLHFENSLSFVWGENLQARTQEEKYLPLIAPLHTKTELRGNFNEVLPWLRNAFAKAQMEVYAKQDRVYEVSGTETPTKGYTLFQAGLGADIVKGDKTLFTVTVLGSNLLNTSYHSHLSRLKYMGSYPNDPRAHGMYEMGRNVSIRVSVPLG